MLISFERIFIFHIVIIFSLTNTYHLILTSFEDFFLKEQIIWGIEDPQSYKLMAVILSEPVDHPFAEVIWGYE
jgi:hypothetical protein